MLIAILLHQLRQLNQQCFLEFTLRRTRYRKHNFWHSAASMLARHLLAASHT